MISRNAPSYSPAERAASMMPGGRRRHAGHIARGGSRTRHDGSMPPHCRQNGGRSRLIPAQHRAHTGPSTGSFRTRRHPAHSGARTTASSALAPWTRPLRVCLLEKFMTLGVAPESLEPVEGTALTAEDVDDEVEVVEQDPFR